MMVAIIGLCKKVVENLLVSSLTDEVGGFFWFGVFWLVVYGFVFLV